jgi:FKBP-type peptidyl-prolyl cis-trans isomerase
MKKTMQFLLAAVALLAWGCSSVGYKKAKSGLEYKIIAGGKDTKLKTGDIIKLNMKATYNDSVIFNTYNFVPSYGKVDSGQNTYDYPDILQEMKVGDSAIILQRVDSLIKHYPGLPKTFKPGTSVKVHFKILEVMAGGERSIPEDKQKEMERFKDAELAQIERYINTKKINAQKMDNMVFVEVQDKGTGPAADSGKYVGIKYTGTGLESGKAFDSNMDTTKQTFKHDLAPFYFTAKRQGAITGMLVGITAFNKGGKGRIYIPSILAYGPQGSPPAIGPNEKLIFDVEVVDVKDSVPPQPSFPGMSRMQKR